MAHLSNRERECVRCVLKLNQLTGQRWDGKGELSAGKTGSLLGANGLSGQQAFAGSQSV